MGDGARVDGVARALSVSAPRPRECPPRGLFGRFPPCRRENRRPDVLHAPETAGTPSRDRRPETSTGGGGEEEARTDDGRTAGADGIGGGEGWRDGRMARVGEWLEWVNGSSG